VAGVADVSDGAEHTYNYSNADGTKTGTIALTSSAAGALTAVVAGKVTATNGTSADLVGMGGNLDGVLAAGASFTVTLTASTKTASLDGGAVARLYSDTGNNTVLTSGLTDGGSADFDLNGVLAGTVGSGTVTVTKTTYNAALTEASTGTVGAQVTGFKAADGEQTFAVGANSMTVNMSGLTAAGTVQFTNADNSLVFQVGANQDQTVKISIQNVAAEMLAANVTNASGFTSLGDIEIDTTAKATDALARSTGPSTRSR
jgi:flagellin